MGCEGPRGEFGKFGELIWWVGGMQVVAVVVVVGARWGVGLRKCGSGGGSCVGGECYGRIIVVGVILMLLCVAIVVCGVMGVLRFNCVLLWCLFCVVCGIVCLVCECCGFDCFMFCVLGL